MCKPNIRKWCFWFLSVTVILGLSITPGWADEVSSPFQRLRIDEGAVLVGEPSQLIGALRPQLVTGDWKPRSNEERTRGPSAAVYPIVAPAVVVVRAGGGHGTGFVVDEDGWIVTNHHVAVHGSIDPKTLIQMATIHFGRMHEGFMQVIDEGVPAVVYKASEEKDLALLKLQRFPQGIEKPAVISLATEPPRLGIDCVAVGHPAMGVLWTVRGGEVSGVGTWPRDMIEVVMHQLTLTGKDREQLESMCQSAPQRKVLLSTCGLNPGDSGGPLVNAKGELIAVSFASPKLDLSREIDLDKFSYHIHLDELRQFLRDRPTAPQLQLPDPWPMGVFVKVFDFDGDGHADALGFADQRKGTPTGLLLDLDQNSDPKRLDTAKSGPTRETWDFEVALHIAPIPRVFLDTNNDQQVDLLLVDQDNDGEPEAVMRLVDGSWQSEEPNGRKTLDASWMTDTSLRKRYSAILATLLAPPPDSKKN